MTSTRLGFLFSRFPLSFPNHLIQSRRALVACLGCLFTGPLIPVSPTISSDPDELQALVWLHFQHGLSLPQFHLSLNLIQPRRASSTRLGYYFHLYPSPPSSVTISISPDERQAFVWAFFSPDLSILPHPVQASYKHSPGYIFIRWTFSLTVSCSPDEQRASSNTHLGYFFLLALRLYLPFRLLVKIATCHYTVRKSIL